MATVAMYYHRVLSLCWNKIIYKPKRTHTFWVVIGYCEISGIHFKILKEWYEYLKNVVELFK